MNTNRSDVIYQLKHALELSTIKRDVLIYACVLGIPWLVFTLGGDTSGAATILGLFLLPTLGFYLWRTIGIFRKPEQYIFCKCVLNKPHSNPFLSAMYFTVLMEMPNGRTQAADTHAIFATHGIFEPIMEDYVNKTVTVAYNLHTGMVVIIG